MFNKWISQVPFIYIYFVRLHNPFFKDRHSSMDCRNPGSRNGLKHAVHGTGCPFPGEHGEFAENLTT